MAITCSTVNDLFQRESGRFSLDVHEHYSVDSPWGRLVRVGKFPEGMGTSLNEVTIERVLSGSFESSWSDVSTGTSGSVSNGCVPSPADLAFGQTVRNWNLQTTSYQTPCICLDDLKTSFQIESQIAKTVQQLTQLTKTVLDNRRRSEYFRLVNKIVAGYSTEFGAGGINTSISTSDGTSHMAPPTVQLSQDQLDTIRVQLIRDGAGQNALGREGGSPVLGLITSPETSRQLLRNNDTLRQDIRFATPSDLIAPLGVDRSYAGFYHMADFEVPRYTWTTPSYNSSGVLLSGGFAQVYPFVSSSTTKGTIWTVNSAYQSAQYEAAFIFHPDVYEEAVQQVGPNIPNASFDDYPYYYSGQFFWLNIRTPDTNPLGKIGRWLSVFNNGSRPIAPYLGKVVIHKRCANDLNFYTCVNS